MNYLVANSRGTGLRDLIPKSQFQKVLYRPGAKFRNLCDLAISIHNQSNSPDNTHVYILAGITDITDKIKSGNYQEVVFKDQIEIAISKVMNTIRTTKTRLEKHKIKVIFCTVSTMNIDKWNTTRLNQKKTSHLNYTSQYQNMQSNLNKALDAINSQIVEINRESNFHTPLVHKAVKHPKGKGKFIFKYNWLVDGVHGNSKAQAQWANSVVTAAVKNRISEQDDNTNEPKRGWRYERFE